MGELLKSLGRDVLELHVITIFNYKKTKLKISKPPSAAREQIPGAAGGGRRAPVRAPPAFLRRGERGRPVFSGPRRAAASPPVLQVLVHGRGAAGRQGQPLHGRRRREEPPPRGDSRPRRSETRPARPAAPPPARLPIGRPGDGGGGAGRALPPGRLLWAGETFRLPAQPAPLGLLFTAGANLKPLAFPGPRRSPWKVTSDTEVQCLEYHGRTEHGLFLRTELFADFVAGLPEFPRSVFSIGV